MREVVDDWTDTENFPSPEKSTSDSLTKTQFVLVWLVVAVGGLLIVGGTAFLIRRCSSRISGGCGQTGLAGGKLPTELNEATFPINQGKRNTIHIHTKTEHYHLCK